MEFQFSTLIKKFIKYVKPDPPGTAPVVVLESLDRFSSPGAIESILSYRSFDEDADVCFLDDGKYPAVGYIVEYAISEAVWDEFYSWLDDFLVKMPVGTIVLSGKLSAPLQPMDIEIDYDSKNFTQELENLEKRFILETSVGPSLLSRARLNARKVSSYFCVRIPYKGPPANVAAIQKFTETALGLRSSLIEKLESLGAQANVLDESGVQYLLRQLCSPPVEAKNEEYFEDAILAGPFQLFSTTNSRYIDSEGHLIYAEENEEGEQDPILSVMAFTVDSFPADTSHLHIQKAVAADLSYSAQIVCPYWAYTLIEVISQEKRNKNVKVGQIFSKEEPEKDPWYFEFFDNQTEQGHVYKNQLKILVGVNLYSPLEDVEENRKKAILSFASQGYRLTEEPFLAFPLFLASLPMQFSPYLNNLGRLGYMESDRVAKLTISTESMASSLEDDGMFVFSRAGAVSKLDLNNALDVLLIGERDSGKSVFMGSVISELLTRNQSIFAITSGVGFKEFAKLHKKPVLEAASDDFGLNVYSLLRSQEEFKAALPFIADLYLSFAYPYLGEDPDISKVHTSISRAVELAWNEFKQNTALKNVMYNLKKENSIVFQALKDAVPAEFIPVLDKQAKGFVHTGKYLEINIQGVKNSGHYSLAALLLVTVLTQRVATAVVAVEDSSLFAEVPCSTILVGSLANEASVKCMWGLSSFDSQILVDMQLLEKNKYRKIVFSQSEDSVKAGIAQKYIPESERAISIVRSVRSFNDSFEIAVQQGNSYSVYLIVKHYAQFLLFTSSEFEKRKIYKLLTAGYTLEKALIKLAQDYYNEKWGSS